MDDTPAKENPAKDFNKLDLSQLQGFSFGTQWTQDKATPSESRERGDRPRREGGDRREGQAPDRRDRRTFRRPAGGDSAPGAPSGGPQGEAAPRREYSGERGPRREFTGPRREGGGGGGPRYGGYGGQGTREMQDRGPYDSPYFSVAFYPEDTSFNALAKTIRSSCRTIELFEIARTVIGKADRFVVVLARKTSESAPAGEGAAPARPARQPIFLSVPDGLPFESEEAVVAHVLSNHLGRFFELAEVEVDPPKGNFQVINRCGVTGELLGPPNYHRYAQIVQQHFSAKITRMSFDAYRSRIETVRDPEVVAQWLAKMKTTTRYTWKPSLRAAANAAAATPAPVATEPATTATEAGAAEVAAPEGTTTPETAPAPVITFDAFEDARGYLLANAREKIVRAVETARFHGKLLETMPPGEIRRAIEGALERQRRFPLDTANALRGRLRREHFTIFKKGSKGISYVCAVKRKFRVPGQTFSETITTLINFIEASPMVRASELPKRFLGIDLPAPPTGSPETSAPAAVAPTEAPAEAPKPEETPKPEEAPKHEAMLTIEQRAKISRMQGDLRWLVTEGYVTEFIDGRLFAPPPMVEARKKEVEAQEHDPENFPEAPQSTPPFESKTEPTPESAPTSSPVAEAVAEAEAQAAAPEVTPESPLTEPERPQVTRPETAPGEPAAAEPSPATDEPAKPGSPA